MTIFRISIQTIGHLIFENKRRYNSKINIQNMNRIQIAYNYCNHLFAYPRYLDIVISVYHQADV